MKNREAREKLCLLYGSRCLLTNIKTNKLTYHHIDKKEHGGKATVDNGANLIAEIHRWVHNTENKDIELFNLINECLMLYKECIRKNNKELIRQYEEECMTLFREKIKCERK